MEWAHDLRERVDCRETLHIKLHVHLMKLIRETFLLYTSGKTFFSKHFICVLYFSPVHKLYENKFWSYSSLEMMLDRKMSAPYLPSWANSKDVLLSSPFTKLMQGHSQMSTGLRVDDPFAHWGLFL